MSTVHVRLELPEELARKLDPSGSDLPGRIRETLALDLFRRGAISTGKGAQLLGVSKRKFRALLHERGIPYFNLTAEELRADVQAAGLALVRDRR